MTEPAQPQPPVAVLDACVLHPPALRDFLLRLAWEEAFLPRWTETIHGEWMNSARKRRADTTSSKKLERTRRLMDASFANAMVKNWEALVPSLSLPDENDRHVLAAAIRAKASVIVTLNLRDFPASALAPHNVEAIHPDDFVIRLWARDANKVVHAARSQRAALRHPPKSVDEHLQTLENQGLNQTVALLRTRAVEL